MEKTIIAIGGGELKSKQTLEIDRYIANLAKIRAGERRAYALFLPTASHDKRPYFNSFRKIYTSEFDIKSDVALMCYGEMNFEKVKSKIEKADIIYAGGGDTVYMLEKWKEWGIDKLLFDAYERGAILCGVSAGAICWFDNIYSDSAAKGTGENYSFFKGLAFIDKNICPHYNLRANDFDREFLNKLSHAYGIEDNSALVFTNGKLSGAISAGGKSYELTKSGDKIIKKEIHTA